MKVFDTHIHSEGRSVEDLEEMRRSGIFKAVTCAFYPIVPRYPETLLDHFRKLSTFEVDRAKSAGMELLPALGIHPRCIPPKHEVVLKNIEEFEFVAFGEIGLETANDLEVEVFVEQLKIAKRLDKPCIIHTPKRGKVEVTEKTLELLQKVGFPGDLAIVDHVTKETIEMVLKAGYFAGLTVQVGKLSVEDVHEIVSKHGFERVVINSDTGFDRADKLATIRAVEYLAEKFEEKDVEKLAFKNAKSIF